ncbi:SH3 domain-containing protein 1 [Amborella trichopoda]|uniref:SH3 domain-containing protein n=1 Tax=Amborella trichopoda TaxID=13333 RepID=U5CZV7_AMBTC|nr:SH3 domain-containing protein 1 [Amborella trichopoda]ERN15704.1 hypothetical protein AMTR_s00048p00229110 [Amborella trichopoda]|eukprot:XP_006854237.1 SH3 domain-containing protein 1 [Amborella trichopoda]
MDTLKRQASKFREQVSKQQQAVLRQFSTHGGNDTVITDEAEVRCHKKLESLYISTRAAKHFQKDVVRSIEGLISTSSKQMEIATKLADDCCKYGNESHSSNTTLASASRQFGTSRNSMESERENLRRILSTQVSEPLRAMVMGAPLEDARLLTHRYDRIFQEVEAQVAEVGRRQLKAKEPGANADSAYKLQNAEMKLSELKSSLSALGKEATAAMMSVEAQQQRLTYQRLITMVEAERSYHKAVADNLDKLHAKMVVEKQRYESGALADVCLSSPSNKDKTENGSGGTANATQKAMYFLAEVLHPFDAQAEGELSLSVGDYVVVRQVSPAGWSEGECKGKAGWFPSAYIELRDKAPASKISDIDPQS